jgi:large repetitive protein
LTCEGGACIYTPAADFNGTDSFTFTVSDGASSDTGSVSIVVTPVNDAPVAIDVPDAETDEDVDVSLNVGGSDVDGDPLTVSDVTDSENGTATVSGPNTVDYVGNPNFNGTDTFDFEIADGQGASDTGTVVVTVHPVNDAPVVDDQAFEGDEDTALPISIAAGDVDGDSLGITVLSDPAFGTLSGTGPDYTYTPGPDFFGADSFAVRVADGSGGADEATISITIDPVNDAPDAAPSSISTAEDTPASFALDASDVDGDALSFEIVTPPASGVVTCVGGACNYEPAGDFNGADLIVFRATDPSGAAGTASVTITVTPVNDQPIAADLLVTTNEDVPVAVTLSATDVDGDLLTFGAGTPAPGVLTGTPPDVVYQPPADFWGSAAFTFSVSDGHGGSDQGIVGITVVQVNDPPVAADSAVATPAGTAVTFALAAVDVDGDPLTFSLLGAPASGSLSCDLSLRVCTYTPAAGVAGEFTLDFAVADGRGGSDTGRVRITVRDVAAPTIVIRSPADGSQIVFGSALQADFECADDIGLPSCVGDVPDGAALATLTPGSATFGVEATDGAGNHATAAAHYRVVYLFEGFRAPIDNGGIANVASAGSRIPMRWRVSGATGAVSDPASLAAVTSRQVACASETVVDVVEETTSTPSGLIYQNNGNWQYTWVTLRSWRNTCREFALGLKDGTIHTALFSFK